MRPDPRPAPATFATLEVGTELPPLQKTPTRTMLFRFSAVTWNAHRIHYDAGYAQTEGHPDVLVQATMHGGFLLEMLRRFVGPRGQIVDFKYSNRARALPDELLTFGGRVTAVHADTRDVECQIWGRKADGTVCAPGTARVRFARQP